MPREPDPWWVYPDWVVTRFGRLHHIVESAPHSSTLCGRWPHEYADAPQCWHPSAQRRPCQHCERIFLRDIWPSLHRTFTEQ